MVAAGAYLRVLREEHYSGRAELAAKLRVDHTQIERLEAGKHAQRGPFLFAVINAVHGNPAHVMELILDGAASEEAGQQKAREWLEETKHLTLPEREALRKRAIALIDILLNDPSLLNELMGYGQRLIEERRDGNETP